MVKKLSMLFAGLMAFTGNLMAEIGEGKFDLTGRLTDVQQQVEPSTSVATTIITAILYILGIIAIAWGIYEIFFDEDKQQQGKKTKGAMKIFGGIAWVGIISFVTWLTQ